MSQLSDTTVRTYRVWRGYRVRIERGDAVLMRSARFATEAEAEDLGRQFARALEVSHVLPEQWEYRP